MDGKRKHEAFTLSAWRTVKSLFWRIVVPMAAIETTAELVFDMPYGDRHGIALVAVIVCWFVHSTHDEFMKE
jgi:hypothetical protein